jgi:hypothetical protein
MADVVLNAEGIILVDTKPHDYTINSCLYINTLKPWQKRFRKFRPHKNIAEILLPFGNARPHTIVKTQEANTKL